MASDEQDKDEPKETTDVVDAPLPRNAGGKVLKAALRAPYWAAHDRAIH